MIDQDLQILIEKAARDELGEEALTELNARANVDPTIAQALSEAREEYRTMSSTAPPLYSPDDLPEIRDAIKARAVTERRQAIFLGTFIPCLCVAFAIFMLLRLDELTLDDVRRAVWLVLGVGGSTSLLVWCWWRWYRTRAAKAASGAPETVEAWVRSRWRGSKREMLVGTILGPLTLIVVLWLVINAIANGDWTTVAFWVVFTLVLSWGNTVMTKIEERHGS